MKNTLVKIKEQNKHFYDYMEETKNMRKISVLGGGSRSWCIEMVLSFLDSNMEPACICLYDKDKTKAEQNVSLFQTYINYKGLKWEICMEEKLQDAIEGSDIIIISIIPEDHEIIKKEIQICEQFGVKHSSGDTVGPAGFMRGLKCVSVFTDYVRLIKETAPDALVLNFTNPLVLSTQVMYKEYPQIKAIGFCPEFLYSEEYYKEICEKLLGEKIDDSYWDYSAIGLNHLLWVKRMTYKGKNMIHMVKEYFDMIPADELNSTSRIIQSIVKKYDGLPGARMEYFLEFLPYDEFLGNVNIVGEYFNEKNIIEARMKHSCAKKILSSEKDKFDFLNGRYTNCYRKDICGICRPGKCWRAICKMIPRIIRVLDGYDSDIITYNMCIGVDRCGHVTELQVDTDKNGFTFEQNDNSCFSKEIQNLLTQQMAMTEEIIEGGRQHDFSALKTTFCKDNMLNAMEYAVREELFEQLMEKCAN